MIKTNGSIGDTRRLDWTANDFFDDAPSIRKLCFGCNRRPIESELAPEFPFISADYIGIPAGYDRVGTIGAHRHWRKKCTIYE